LSRFAGVTDPAQVPVNVASIRQTGATDFTFSYPDYAAVRDSVRAFRGVIAFSPERMTLSGTGAGASDRSSAAGWVGRLGLIPSRASNAEFASVFVVSENYFSSLLTLYHSTGSIIRAMRIGELATRAGVNVQTIRFYERKHLLLTPPRTASGYRSYADHDLATVSFIKNCQHLGFTLKEIKELLGVHGSLAALPTARRDRLGNPSRLFRIVYERLTLIDEKILLLTGMRERLAAALDQGRTRLMECPAGARPRNRAPRSRNPSTERLHK
jgi:MerR family mercuric resistance operon transcriptional regulator